MDLIKKIKDVVAEGWQVQSVWIVPPESHVSKNGCWEAHVKRADFVPCGEGGVTDVIAKVDESKLPKGIKSISREKVCDEIINLPCMSFEQAEALAVDLAENGDASGIQKTASGCLAIGPFAAWVREPLRSAILNSRR